MVRANEVCLNSALDSLHDWNTALKGEFGPYAHVIIDELVSEDDPPDLADEQRIGGPRP